MTETKTIEQQKKDINDLTELYQHQTTTETTTTEQPKQNPTLPLTHTTKVNLRLSGERDVISIRILPQVKEAFTRHCKQLGLSTCHVAEGLFTAFVYGVEQDLSKVNLGCTKIDLTLVRDVKRVRRYAKEVYEDVYETSINTVSRAGCDVCGGKGYAVVTRSDKSRVCLCQQHFDVERKQGQLVGWKVLGQ